jgi:hypothetical protein
MTDASRLLWEAEQEQRKREARCITVYPYWLGYSTMAAGLLEDYNVDPRDHPKVVDELDQGIGEAIIDTLLSVLDDHEADPRIAAALREARGQA